MDNGAGTTNYGPPTRQTLLGRVLAGDDPSWEDFYRIYAPFIKWLCRKRGVTAVAQQQEIVQRVMVRFDQKRGAFRLEPGRPFRGYLGCMTKYLIAEFFRELARHSPGPPLSSPDDKSAPSRLELLPDERDRCQATVQREVYWHAIATLRADATVPAEYREVLQLLLEGRSIADISRATGLTANHVYQAKHRLAQRLQRIVRKEMDE